jgi:hypothetical protein
LKVKPKSLDDIVSDKIKFLSSPDASLGSSELVVRFSELIQQLLEVILQSILYITYSSGLADTFNIETYMVRDDKLYTLLFTTGSFFVPETLPTAQKIIHSFQFIS